MTERKREASVETMRRLAEAVDKFWNAPMDAAVTMAAHGAVADALAAYRSEIAPLRTRAEVDSEIAAAVRECYGKRAREEPLLPRHLWNEKALRLIDLCREPTAPEASGPPSASAAKESTDKAGAEEGAAYRESHACHPDERECNCNQALALKEQFARFVYYNFGGWLTNDADREARWDEMRYLPEDVRARVEGYHAQRVATGEIPQWCSPPQSRPSGS